jgi:hypothetical protein
MTSVSRIHLLRAALALETFTAKDLADETAIPLESVRNYFKRPGSPFCEAGHDERVATMRRPGRPAKLYRLGDPETAANELADVSGLIADAGRTEIEVRTIADQNRSVLDLALANLRAAMTEPLDDEERTSTIDAAERSASVVLQRVGSADGDRARAFEYIAVSFIARCLLAVDPTTQLGMLRQATSAAGQAHKFDGDAARRVARLLIATAKKTGIDPPIVEVARRRVPAASNLFGGHVTDITIAGQACRAPSYADAVMLRHSPAGVVYRVGNDDTPETVEAALGKLDALRVPTYVALPYTEHDASRSASIQRTAFHMGAYSMPADAGKDDVVEAVGSALDKSEAIGANRILVDAIDAMELRSAAHGQGRGCNSNPAFTVFQFKQAT